MIDVYTSFSVVFSQGYLIFWGPEDKEAFIPYIRRGWRSFSMQILTQTSFYYFFILTFDPPNKPFQSDAPIKWEVYFFKEVFPRLYYRVVMILSAWICIWVYNITMIMVFYFLFVNALFMFLYAYKVYIMLCCRRCHLRWMIISF